MSYVSVRDFIGVRLPAMVAGRHSMRALFVTYNEVNGYASGEHETGKPGLKVFIQAGDLYGASAMQFASGLILGTPPGSSSFNSGVDLSCAVASDTQRDLEAAIEQQGVLDEEGALVFVYAGLSAFDSALEYASNLRQRKPTTQVVVVTCDCDLSHKMRKLNLELERGNLAAVVATWRCGGRADMAELLQALIDVWSPPVTAS